MSDRCFACDKPLLTPAILADTRDAQVVHVGPDCAKKIAKAGDAGYQPPKGGPRLYPIRSRKD